MRNTILHGDVIDIIKTLLAESINCAITSPPYFGLRDYQLPPTNWPEVAYAPMAGLPDLVIPAMTCCLGLEDSIEAYVGHLVLVFRELWRVLRGDGVAWLNLGDSYASQGGPQVDGTMQTAGSQNGAWNGQSRTGNGLKPKNLCGIPWRVAFALQADGWYLRSDVIWAKKNGLPESVKDRPTKAHEYLFLLAKSERYWYDQDAIREENQITTTSGGWASARNKGDMKYDGLYKRRKTQGASGGSNIINNPEVLLQGRNKRTVWSIASQPLKAAHFAVMPEALVEPCLLAGCPSRVCVECGEPWVREVEQEKGEPQNFKGSTFNNGKTGKAQNALSKVGKPERTVSNKTIGFAPTCQCCPLPAFTIDVFGRHLPIYNAHRPGIAIDPFFGAATVGVVAKKKKRDWIGIELNPDYIKLAWERLDTTQPALFVE